MLLNVERLYFHRLTQLLFLFAATFAGVLTLASQEKQQAAPTGASNANPQGAAGGAQFPTPTGQAAAPVVTLRTVVIDPAHGGTDTGARGTEGMQESDVVLRLAAYVRRALESQGFTVVMTRDGSENPPFDERSARANAQRGAIFITLHAGSTGLAGTARVYAFPEMPATNDATGLIAWDRAQAGVTGQSHKLGDLVQIELAKKFKGSPNAVLTAPVRQLRTTAIPAIAVELSSVSVEDNTVLDRMLPGVGEAIARGVVNFKPVYQAPSAAATVPQATAAPQAVKP